MSNLGRCVPVFPFLLVSLDHVEQISNVGSDLLKSGCGYDIHM